MDVLVELRLELQTDRHAAVVALSIDWARFVDAVPILQKLVLHGGNYPETPPRGMKNSNRPPTVVVRPGLYSDPLRVVNPVPRMRPSLAAFAFLESLRELELSNLYAQNTKSDLTPREITAWLKVAPAQLRRLVLLQRAGVSRGKLGPETWTPFRAISADLHLTYVELDCGISFPPVVEIVSSCSQLQVLKLGASTHPPTKAQWLELCRTFRSDALTHVVIPRIVDAPSPWRGSFPYFHTPEQLGGWDARSFVTDSSTHALLRDRFLLRDAPLCVASVVLMPLAVPALTVLHLGCDAHESAFPVLTAASARAISSTFPKLQELLMGIDCSRTTDLALAELQLPLLRVLQIARAPIGVEGVLNIANGCPNLRELRLFNCQYVNDDVVHLIHYRILPKLKKVRIDNCGMTTQMHDVVVVNDPHVSDSRGIDGVVTTSAGAGFAFKYGLQTSGESAESPQEEALWPDTMQMRFGLSDGSAQQYATVLDHFYCGYCRQYVGCEKLGGEAECDDCAANGLSFCVECEEKQTPNRACPICISSHGHVNTHGIEAYFQPAFDHRAAKKQRLADGDVTTASGAGGVP
jgi:hypothetical protein